MGDSLGYQPQQPQKNIYFERLISPYIQFFDIVRNVFSQHQQNRQIQQQMLENFPSVDPEPWDFWGNIAKFYGLDGTQMPTLPRRGTYVNPQWGKENTKIMKEILEE